METTEWININKEKPPHDDKLMKWFSIEVKVLTPFGEGIGRYNYLDNDWLISLNDNPADELQAYKGVTYWAILKVTKGGEQ